MLTRLLEFQATDSVAESNIEFAAIDVETTGLFPRAHDRVVEIGVVVVDEAGSAQDEYSTLVNPGRDLGPTEIHGIRGRDVVDAPVFAEIIGDVCERLRGRVLVAHNARFDRDFLASEFEHAGYALPVAPWVCTMALGSRVTGARRLSSCCEALRLDVTPSHSARDDAWAAALILAACLESRDGRSAVESALAETPLGGADGWPLVPATGRCVMRSEGRPRRQESYITTLLDRLPVEAGTGDSVGVAYLELLDRVLEDRVLTAEEGQALVDLAGSWGLGRDDCVALHDRYMRALVAAAWQDGVVTDAERADLDDVAALLAIAPATLKEMLEESPREGAITQLPSGGDQPLAGKSVCFTGQLTCTIAGEPITRDRAEMLAEDRGLIVKANVSKELDLLVVADPDSLSGKARKARDYGTRIIVERAFWRAAGVKVD